MQIHEQFIRRCIELARLGKGEVSPNPMVGAVIVCEGKIIGEGYHKKFGEAHAEVNAIASVKDKSLLKNSTIYVSLEPCAHHGKTPPCANLIVEHNIPRVVVGARDPHSEVDGKGIHILKQNNIEVTSGILEEECIDLNKHFFYFHQTQKPFVLLKWAQTQNGFIDNEGKQTWITNPASQTIVHQLRKEYQAILVGRKTVENDNPELTVRRVEGNNPIRVVIDPNLKLIKGSKVFNSAAPTLVINNLKNEIQGNIEFIKISKINTNKILEELAKRNIISVLIEGGKQTLESFISANLWNEAKVFIGQKEFDDGTHAPSIKGETIEKVNHFGDQILTIIPE